MSLVLKKQEYFFTSSVAVYGLNKIKPNESYEIDPFNHYGKKQMAS